MTLSVNSVTNLLRWLLKCDVPPHPSLDHTIIPHQNCCFLGLYAPLFRIASHCNPLCPGFPIAAWPVLYDFFPNYPITSYSLFLSFDLFHSNIFQTYSLPLITFHREPLMLRSFQSLPTPILLIDPH